jgi:serine/threonine protein kinase
VGEGSYAKVFKGIDYLTGQTLALKRLNVDATEVENTRFRHEFEVMKGLDSPYIVKVYKFFDSSNEYLMEFMPQTLKDFMGHNNAKLDDVRRKDMALQLIQFLRGIDYLHRKERLHRDLSYSNILVKHHDDQSVNIKICDFGLAKDGDLSLTRTAESKKGTLLDPLLENYKDYSVFNEIYSVGMILNYIFRGSASRAKESPAAAIIEKAVAISYEQRYQSVREIGLAIRDM